jgi:biopolymer transport protein ExbD
VLLVIFIAQLPLAQRGHDINLPLETNTNAQAATVLGQIVADYTADHQLTINKEPVDITQAQTRFTQIFRDDPTRKDKTLFLIGAGSVKYGEIMAVIDAAVGGGVEKVGIVTDGMRAEAAAQSKK